MSTDSIAYKISLQSVEFTLFVYRGQVKTNPTKVFLIQIATNYL